MTKDLSSSVALTAIYYVLALVLASWVLFGNNAMSETPDGMTPAEEGICDYEEGAAYGLCVSYCEAMDCMHAERHSDIQACERVRENYERTAGTGEPFPCEKCPCDFYLVPPTAACLGTVYERKLEIIKTTIDSDTEVRSSIMAEGKNGEMMNAYVVDSTTNGGSCMIEITNKDDHPCTEDATAKVKAELLPPRVANVCLQTFAQYTQDAIFKASQRKLIEIKLQAE